MMPMVDGTNDNGFVELKMDFGTIANVSVAKDALKLREEARWVAIGIVGSAQHPMSTGRKQQLT